MITTGQFAKIKTSLRAMTERWRSFRNKPVIPPPKPKSPKLTVQEVDFKIAAPPPQDGPFNSRECISRAQMNRTRAHRRRMKKHNRHQRKMNKWHGVRV